MNTSETQVNTILITVLSTAVVGCNDQTPIINEDNALRAASCALSPMDFNDLAVLSGTLQQQQAGPCPGGGLILRTDTANATEIVADHCITANDTSLRGTFTQTDINDNPAEWNLDFDQISSNQQGNGEEVHGLINLTQSQVDEHFKQTLRFDNLLLGEITDSVATAYIYGQTEHKVSQSIADSSTTVEYSSRVERCGSDFFGLDVSTVKALEWLESDTSYSAGTVVARAGDDSNMTISFNSDLLAIDLDSNGDSVDDLQLSMSWQEFQGSTTVASRRRAAAPAQQAPVFWPMHR